MGRTLMSPAELNMSRRVALFFLEGGLSSYRAVADALGVDHTTIRSWDRARDVDGSPAPVRFDRHESEGAAWDEADAVAKQQVRAGRRAAARGPDIKVALLGPECAPDEQPAPPKYRRRRARRIGPMLKAFLAERVADVGAAVAAADFVARRSREDQELDDEGYFAWDTPALRGRVKLIVDDAGATGIRTRAIVSRLPPAYDENEPIFILEFEFALRAWAFVQTADGFWRSS